MSDALTFGIGVLVGSFLTAAFVYAYVLILLGDDQDGLDPRLPTPNPSKDHHGQLSSDPG